LLAEEQIYSRVHSATLIRLASTGLLQRALERAKFIHNEKYELPESMPSETHRRQAEAMEISRNYARAIMNGSPHLAQASKPWHHGPFPKFNIAT